MNQIIGYNADDDFTYMRKSDIITPRLALQQFLSPGVTAQTYKPGDYVILDEKRTFIPFGKVGVFTPLIFWMNWIEWNPDQEAPKDKRIIDSSFDPQSNLCKRAERFEEIQTVDGPRIAVTEYYNWVVALNGEPDKIVYNWDDLAVLNFSKSSHRRGKEFLNRLYKLKTAENTRAPMCSHNFNLSVVFRDEGAKKKFMAPEIGAASRETPADMMPQLLELVTLLRSNRQQIMERDVEKEKEESAVQATVVENKNNI